MDFLRLIWASALKDTRRRMRDPVAFLMWLGIPLVIGGMVVLVNSGGSDGPPKARIWIVDEDDSFFSNFLVQALDQGGPFDGEVLELERARARIDDGEGSAMLVVPDGFGESLLKETPSTLQLVTNPSQRILPGIVEEALEILTEGSFYLHRILGDELRTIADGPIEGDFFENETIADLSVRINDTIRELEETLFPPVIQLAVDKGDGDEEDEPFNLGDIFFPTFFFMSLMFAAQGLSDDLWQERKQGTLRRIVATPYQTGAFLLGKLLAAALLFAAIGTAALILGWLVFDFEPARLVPALAWIIFAGCVMTILMMTLQLFASSQRGGGLVTNLVLFPLLMAGGSFFPFEAMPDGMASFGKRTPNGMALVQLKSILAGRFEAGPWLVTTAILLVAGVILYVIATRRLHGGFAR